MKIATKVTLVTSSILLFFLLTTDPQKLPSAFLVVPFALLFIVILALISRIFGIYQPSATGKFRIGLVGAAAPVMLLVLQSLGQLTIRDMLAVFAFFVVAYVYMSRFGAQAAG